MGAQQSQGSYAPEAVSDKPIKLNKPYSKIANKANATKLHSQKANVQASADKLKDKQRDKLKDKPKDKQKDNPKDKLMEPKKPDSLPHKPKKLVIKKLTLASKNEHDTKNTDEKLLWTRLVCAKDGYKKYEVYKETSDDDPPDDNTEPILVFLVLPNNYIMSFEKV
ncbi:hypothetical protein KR018_009254 [Drosophila ironensis]|nr:hypothetical protein KR018_009254 [Drosophila ironensis]